MNSRIFVSLMCACIPVIVAAQPVVVHLEPSHAITRLARPALIPFDDIRSVQVVDDGRTLMLDKRASMLDVYRKDGHYAFSLPLRSDGRRVIPPIAFAVTRKGTIATIEMFGKAVVLYTLQRDSVDFLKVVELPSRPASICEMGNVFFVYLAQPDGRVWQVTENGSKKIAFHIPRPNGLPSGLDHYADRNLLCLRETGLVIDYGSDFPTIVAHLANGKLAWTTVLSRFKSPEFLQTRNGWRVSLTGHVRDVIVGSFELGDIIGIQTRKVSKLGDAEDPENVPQTRLVSARDGEEIAIAAGMPLVSGIHARMLYTFRPNTGLVYGSHLNISVR